MKKVILAIALVTGFAACQKNETVVLETGSLKLKATVEETAIGKKGGDVSSEGIPVYVKGVDVVVTGPGGHVVGENFMYTAEGKDAMVIDDIAIGYNTIEAVSIPISNPFPHTFMGANLNAWDYWGDDFKNTYSWVLDFKTLKTFMATMTSKPSNVTSDRVSKFIDFIVGYERNQEKGAPVYAVYEGSNGGVVTNVENNEPLEVLMTTNNGRQMVTFMVSDLEMLNLYDIEILGACSTSPLVRVEGRYTKTTVEDGQVILNANTPLAMSYWSNAASVDGAVTSYTINFREKGTKEVLRTDNLDITVKAGVSLWTNVVINETAFFVDNQPLSITYTPLNEDNEDLTID